MTPEEISALWQILLSCQHSKRGHENCDMVGHLESALAQARAEALWEAADKCAEIARDCAMKAAYQREAESNLDLATTFEDEANALRYAETEIRSLAAGPPAGTPPAEPGEGEK